MALDKYLFNPGEFLPAKNVNSIDPDNLQELSPAKLVGGTDVVLSNFEALVAGLNNGAVKAIIDGVEYDNLSISLEITDNEDIDSAVNDSKSFNTSSQGGNNKSFTFNLDGTKLYVSSNDEYIYQYTLSTAWDISTASYDDVNYYFNKPDSISKIFINRAGTKLYLLNTNETIYQYTLTTPWDLSTAVDDSKSIYIASFAPDPQSIFFKPDGTSLYILSSNLKRVCQYNLSTAWDISTATYFNFSPSVSSLESYWYSMFFNTKGTKLYLAGYSNIVYQFTLSTPWNVTTSTYDSISYNFGYDLNRQPRELFFKSDGTKMYYLGDDTEIIYQYSFPDPLWILSLDNVASSLQTAIRAETGNTETVVYDTDHFEITSSITTDESEVLKLQAPTTGTDISGAGYLDLGANATEVAKTGDDYKLVRLDEEGKMPSSLSGFSFIENQNFTSTNNSGTGIAGTHNVPEGTGRIVAYCKNGYYSSGGSNRALMLECYVDKHKTVGGMSGLPYAATGVVIGIEITFDPVARTMTITSGSAPYYPIGNFTFSFYRY